MTTNQHANLPIKPAVHDNDVETARQACLMAEFNRLYHQYRRTGYEYYQRVPRLDLALNGGNVDQLLPKADPKR